MTPPLRLRAEDSEDLAVVAACLEDALASVGEMAFEPDEARFAAVVVRRMWEDALHQQGDAQLPPDDVKTGLHFDGVSAVHLRGMDQSNRRAVFKLVTILCEPPKKPKTVKLLFAHGGEIRLEIEKLHCCVQDLEPPRRQTPADDDDDS